MCAWGSLPAVHAHDPFETRQRSVGEIIRRVIVYLRPYPGLAAGTIACAILSLAFAFAYPKLTQLIIDEVISGHRPELLTPTALGLIGAFVLRDFFNSVRIRLNNTFEQNVVFDMRRSIYRRLQELPVGYFEPRASGDLMTRVIEDVAAVERLLIDGTEQGTVAVLSVVGVTIILIWTQPLLAAVAFLPIPILTAGALWYTVTARDRYRAQRRAASAMNALLMDNLAGIRQIKAYGREKHEFDRFSARAADMRAATLRIMRTWAVYSPAMGFTGALGMALVTWVGGNQVLNGQLSLGQLISFLFYLALFYEPITRLHGLNQMMQAARAAGERVFDILDAVPEHHDRRRLALPENIRGDIVYDRVHFGYIPERPVLQNIRLHARPGQCVALVGPTGAGKSTLVNLLIGFYEIGDGAIRIDGHDISQVTLESLRAKIAVVSQEPFLFNGTVRENILYGRIEASPEEMIAAAEAANCHQFIARLPDGYDSIVGERGVKLSVGEKQRISIARALLKNAPILILDEATASVDTATEGLIQQALEKLLAGRTSLVIAHRLSTIRRADQILVLQAGEIVERGTHDALVAAGGLYARLAQVQNTATIEETFRQLLRTQ